MPDAFADARQALRVFAIGAVVLVVLSTVLFWMIGAVSGDDDGIVVTSPTSSEQPAGGDGSSSEPSDGVPSEPATDGASEPVSAAPTDTTSSAATEPADLPSDDSSTVASSDLEKAAGLTVQVLDAVLDDGRALHGGVVTCLRSAGFGSLITGNSASRVYDVTAVFYTDAGDNEAAARAVAQEFGFSRVEVKPDNLSDTVALHIVVGRDATNPC